MRFEMDKLGERVRSFVRRTFGKHETLEEETDWQPDHEVQEASGSRSLSTDYTELMGGSVPCPSCKGTGRIPRGINVTF